MTNSLDAFVSKMTTEDLPRLVIETFSYYYHQLVSGETGLLSDADIQPVSPGDILNAEDFHSYSKAGRAAMRKTVAIVLNGGLGTSMGLTRAKSLVPVKDGKTFLEIKLKQAEQCGAQLAFMNSFNTHKDTVAAVSKSQTSLQPAYFIQNKFPKVLAATFLPAHWPDNPELEWNPPGHGDIYAALYGSGLLDRWLSDGVVYAFLANSDNLGATLDEALLGYFAEHDHPFMMEVAERTPADLKGGHLARNKSGTLVLREIAQCPEDEIASFQDIQRYRFFNTNNLWVNLNDLKVLFEEKGALHLPMIVNPKTVNPRQADSPRVYQIETAMGAAISMFDRATAVKVPENRFLPVKKCQDLLAIRSDCYQLTDDCRLILNPKRNSPPPKIVLDPQFFSHLDEFNRRFQWIPSLKACTALNVQGDIFFQKDITLSGTVTITNAGNAPATIPAGTRISGNLKIQ